MAGYDYRCFDLAIAFLAGYGLSREDHEAKAEHLATVIQRAIESELETLVNAP